MFFYNPSLVGKFAHVFQSWAMPVYSRSCSEELPLCQRFINVANEGVKN